MSWACLDCREDHPGRYMFCPITGRHRHDAPAVNNPDDPIRLEHVDGTATVRPRFVADVSIDRHHNSVGVKMLSGSLYEVALLTQAAPKPDEYPGTEEQWAQGYTEYNHWPNDEHPEKGWLLTEQPRAAGPVTEDIETLEEAWERVSRLLHMWPVVGSAKLEAT